MFSLEKLAGSTSVPLMLTPMNASASLGAQQYGQSSQREVFPIRPGRKIPKAVLITIGRNIPTLKVKSRQKGICQAEAIIMAILPTIERPIVNTTVAGDMILLIDINSANTKPANISFSIKIRFLLIQNFFKLIGAE